MTSAPSLDAIRDALSGLADPSSGLGLIESGLVQGLRHKDGKISFVIEAPDASPAYEALRAAAEQAVRALPGVTQVLAVLTAHSATPSTRPAPRTAPRTVRIEDGAVKDRPAGAAPRTDAATSGAGQRLTLPGVKHIIAVASGKGGVGKSTVAANLALGLARLGRKTGLLDADIYGPSVPHLFGITQRPETKDGKKLETILTAGLSVMSIGLLVDPDTPMIWRGPMVMSALTQMMNDVNWGALDVLVVDMPPGTGDAQLTMAQRVPLSGAVIVSTPQDIALIDARKGLAMFRKTEVPVLGIIENMSVFVCPNCGHESHIFGHGGARATAQQLACDFLGEIPLHMAIRETSDGGLPIVASAPESPQARAFIAIAQTVADRLDAGHGAKRAPKIVFAD